MQMASSFDANYKQGWWDFGNSLIQAKEQRLSDSSCIIDENADDNAVLQGEPAIENHGRAYHVNIEDGLVDNPRALIFGHTLQWTNGFGNIACLMISIWKLDEFLHLGGNVKFSEWWFCYEQRCSETMKSLESAYFISAAGTPIYCQQRLFCDINQRWTAPYPMYFFLLENCLIYRNLVFLLSLR